MYQNDYAYPAPPDAPVTPPAQGNLTCIKEFCRKPLLLILAILSSVSCVLTLVSGFINADDVATMLAYSSGMQYSQYQSLLTGYMVTLVIFSVPAILMAVSFWLIYLRSRSDNPSSSPLPGFSILRVLVIIEFVFIGLLAALFVLFFIAMAAAASDMRGSTASFYAVGMGVIIFVMILVLAVLLLFALSQFSFVNSFRNSLRGPQLQTKGAVFYGVMMILSALSALSTLTSSSSYVQLLQEELPGSSQLYTQATSPTPLSIAASLISIAFAVCAAVFAFSYNGYVKKINAQRIPVPAPMPPYGGGYPQPPYGQPVNPAQPPMGGAYNYNDPYAQPPQPQGYGAPYQPQTPPSAQGGYTNPYAPQPQTAPPAQQPYAPLPYQPVNPPVTPNPVQPPVAPAAPAYQPEAPVTETPAVPGQGDGSPMQEDAEMKYCPMCGAKLDGAVGECPRCGMKL